MGGNSLPKTVTRQRRGCDLNPGRMAWVQIPAPESITLTTRLPSHPLRRKFGIFTRSVWWTNRPSGHQRSYTKRLIIVQTAYNDSERSAYRVCYVMRVCASFLPRDAMHPR